MPFFRSKRVPPVPEFDFHSGDPRLAELRQITASLDWVSLEFFFEQVDNWDDQSYYISEFAEIPDTEQWLYQLAQRADQGTLAPLLLAGRRIVMAWEIRTRKLARYVSQEQFTGFFEHLRVAEAILQDIVKVEPDNAAAWSMLVTTARGLQLGQDEARRRYDEVAKYSPHHLEAQQSLLQQLCPKWGGTFEEAHAFARECLLSAPPGSPQGELVAWAHLEQSFDHPVDRQAEYLQQQRVRGDLLEAVNRSVLHPEFRRGPRWLEAHNVFAFVLSIAGEYFTAKQVFLAMGDAASLTPWERFFDDPYAGLSAAWKLAWRNG